MFIGLPYYITVTFTQLSPFSPGYGAMMPAVSLRSITNSIVYNISVTKSCRQTTLHIWIKNNICIHNNNNVIFSVSSAVAGVNVPTVPSALQKTRRRKSGISGALRRGLEPLSQDAPFPVPRLLKRKDRKPEGFTMLYN